MRTYTACYSCFLRQAKEAAQMAGATNQEIETIVQQAHDIFKQLPADSSPPAIGTKVHQLVQKITGVDDPYKEVKRLSTAKAFALLPSLVDIVNSSDDKLEAAIRISIAGNIIDFGANPDHDLEEVVHRFLTQDFAINDLGQLRQELEFAESVLILGDNAGETVLDRLLIEALSKTVIYAVRGGPIINDATIEDAVEAGLDKLATIIDNGTRIPGTVLDECSPAFQEAFRSADLILAKGMGNYETLSTIPGPIFFLFQVKCPVVSEDIEAPVGSMIVKKSAAFSRGFIV